jgi:hypothetical protein
VTDLFPENLTEPLQGKSATERDAVAHAIADAAKRNLYPLSVEERRALSRFVTLTAQKLPIDAEVLRVMNRLVRQHQQHLIALSRKVR